MTNLIHCAEMLSVRVISPWCVFLLTLALYRTSLSFLQEKKYINNVIYGSRSHSTFTAKGFANVSYYILKAKNESFNIYRQTILSNSSTIQNGYSDLSIIDFSDKDFVHKS